MNRNDNATTQTLRRRCFEALLVGMFYVPYWILEQCSQLTSGISAIGFLFVLLVSTISTMFEAIMQIFSIFNKLFAVVLKTVSWVFKLLASVFNSQFFTRKFARSSLLGYLLSKMASVISGITWIVEKINWIVDALRVVVTLALLVVSSLLQIIAGAFQLTSLALKFTSFFFWLLSLPSRGLVWFLHWRAKVKVGTAVGVLPAVGAAPGPPPPAAAAIGQPDAPPAVGQPLIPPPIGGDIAPVEAAAIDVGPVEDVHVAAAAVVPLRRNPVRKCRLAKQVPVAKAVRRPRKTTKNARKKQLVDTQVELPPAGAGVAPHVGDVALPIAADAIGDSEGNVGALNQHPLSTVTVDRSDMALVLVVSAVVAYVFLKSPLLHLLVLRLWT